MRAPATVPADASVTAANTALAQALPALIIENVSRAFGPVAVVRELSLTVAPGEIVCLLGPSGCGKTTALRLVAGLDRPDRGRILLGGREVFGPHADEPPERRDVGLLFQDFALFPHLTVAENVGFGIRRLPAGERQRRVAELLSSLRVTELSGAYPHTLSGGQQQRVALARALAPRPGLMLLDEPFSGLDVRLRAAVRDQVRDALRAQRVAVLMVTHDPDEAMVMADRMAVMRDGRILQTGAPEAIYHRPETLFVATFLGEVNRLPGIVRHGTVRTVLGEVSAGGLPEGSVAAVVLRPERVRVHPEGAGEGVPACVEWRRFEGGTSLLGLTLGGVAEHATLIARVMDKRLPETGSRVQIVVDPADMVPVPDEPDPISSPRGP